MNYVKAASNTGSQSEPPATAMGVIVAPAIR